MNKIIVFCFLIFSLTNLFSNWVEIEQNVNQQLFDHSSYGKESTIINFSLTGYEQETISVDGTEYQKITIPYEGDFVEIGKPDLPCFTRLIAIPNSGTPRLEIVGFDEEIISDITVFPRQILQSESQVNRSDFEIDEEYYMGENLFPASICEIGRPAVMRDLRLVAVTINPFQYDPKSNELKIYTNVEVTIQTDGSGGVNAKQNSAKISRAFESTYKATILNYDSTISRDITYQDPSYLFIHTNDTSVASTLEYLTDWKHQKGFEVNVHSVNSGTSFNTIKSYIQDAYNNWENPPEFVCLVGDASGSYNIPTDYSGSGTGDQGYTRLDGTDILADVLIGRLSIDSISDLQTIVAKILHYEMQPYMGQTDWYNKVLLVADPSHSGTSTIDTKQHIKQIMEVYNPDFDFIEVYGGSFSSAMTNNLNSGVSYINYRGYMGMSGFGNSQINSLNNGYMLPVATIPTCDTGTFYSGTSRSEEFLRAGTSTIPKGAIASFGTATTSTHTCFNNIVDAGTYYGLFVDHIFTMGSALNRGKIALYNNYMNQPNYVSQFSYWNSLMGDPGMDVWTGIPQDLIVNYDVQIALGTNNLVVIVEDSNGFPLENAWVTALQGDDDIFATGWTDANGEIILEINAQNTGSADLTVTKHDFIPHLGSFDVGQVDRFVNVFEYNIDDDNIGDSSGNNDGIINPGEVIEFNVSLQNTGNFTANGVTATLSSESDYITITDDTETFGNILSGSTNYCTEDFDFAVDADVLGGMEILFELLIEDNIGNQWTDYINVLVEGANLYYSDFNFPGQPNGILEPGGSGNLVITLENLGLVGANNVYGIITCENELINLNDSEGFFGNISAGASAANTTNTFNITASSQIISGAQIIINLQLYNADGYDDDIPVTIEIGSVETTDPIGPDAYGYYCFDDTDTAYSSSPVYDWIEINSIGTQLPLNDNGQTGDVADISNLPFIFQFYGEIYSSLSVCSNGWIAPGHTDNTSFMNWQIPGPQGPIPMIAAFWDDLKTGDVYYYHDTAENIFIIEWDDMENQHVAVEETFQIIIYDSGHYPTATGDNEIKIQYKEFNNVDTGNYPSNHGQYCSIGIEDHTSTVGLEYTFNNQYPNSAAVLQDGSAIKFTTMGGGTQEPPEMVLSQTSFDFIVQPGSSDDQTLEISNNGEANLVYSFSKNYQINLEQVQRNNGGPDNYGYMWYDSAETYGPVYSWRDISALGTAVTFSHNDQGTDLMPIGFDFNFYGVNYADFRINPNGWIGFGDDNTEWTNTVLPDPTSPHPAIMPFWDDLNPLEGGDVYYYSTSDSLVVWFYDVIHYVGTNNGTYDFQMIIYATGEMLFQYREVSGDIATATIGIQNETADDALQICYNTSYVQDELAIKIIKTDDWLDLQPTSGLVANGETEIITLSASAEDMESGDYICDLMLTTNDPNAGSTTIPVNMIISSSFPQISLSETSFDFGVVAVGESLTDTLTVSNVGNEILLISEIQTSLPEFTVSPSTTSIDPDESVEFYITFTPSSGISSSATMTIFSNDPINPEAEVSLLGNVQFPIIVVSETFIDFGGIVLGEQLVDTLIVSNFGSEILHVSDVELNSTVFTTNIDNFTVNPGTSEELLIEYTPENIDPDYAIMILHSNDPDNPEVEVELTGFSLYPIIDLSASELNFGTIFIGDTITDTLFIQNIGNADLIVTNIYNELDVYTLSSNSAIIPPEATEEILVTFSPIEEIQYADSIWIEAETPYQSIFQVSMLGFGEEPVHANNILPLVNKVYPNYPNPFNPTTTIKYAVSELAEVSIAIYNIKGEKVKTLVRESKEPSYYQAVWNGKDDTGKTVSSGVYFYQTKIGDYKSYNKMLLMK
jgi:Peptidase family C25/Propeptide_C25/HYDIN/CFA65/VesB-like, Ig-like domain